MAHPGQVPTLPLFLDQTEPRKAVKKILRPPSPLSQGLSDSTPPPPTLSVDLDPPQICTQNDTEYH